MRAKEIRAGVEELLGSPVSRHLIKSHLHGGYHRDPPRFERLARGRYRLLLDARGAAEALVRAR
jgi:hypothetical protein